ncbi:ATPase domain-containing protein [Natronomonas pharaonis]|nr:ATPase domain-containing protein [Natronomonas pharaonis]
MMQGDSGVVGLNQLLRGGYLRNRMYLIVGTHGTGKTTLCSHFVEAGLDAGETALFVHGEESASELRENAAQFGIDIAGAEFLDLGPDSAFFEKDETYDLVDASEVEGKRYTEQIREAITEIDPDRLVIDPITQLRYIEASDYHYRKRVLSLIRFLKEHEITVLGTTSVSDTHSTASEILSISDGVVRLSRSETGRRIEVEKNRGRGQQSGTHGVEIRAHGVEVFPKLTPPESPAERRGLDPVATGVGELDSLTGGGFEHGTTTFISGPPGVGKTTVGAYFLFWAAQQGETAAVYLFEERIETFEKRCRAIGLPIDALRDDGRLKLTRIEPNAMSAEEFANIVRTDVVDGGVTTAMIDGFSGYTTSIQGEQDTLKRDLHALLRHLNELDVAVFMTEAVHQITGLTSATSRNISPLADNLLFLTYVELGGSLGRVIGMLKKRTGSFESGIREFEITDEGVQLGAPLDHLQGLLEGTPSTRGHRLESSDTEP